MARLRVGVLRGGPSAEHDVSLKTGENVLKFLPEKYEGVDVVLSKDGQLIANKKPINLHQLRYFADIVFNGLHGYFGEDGKVQHIFENLKIPLTGSGVLGSALAMNKVLSREFFSKAGLKIPRAIIVKRGEPPAEAASRIFQKMSPLWVVKPASGGSSIGVSIARDFNELVSGIEKVFEIDSTAIVEEHIKGKEVTCGVIDDFRGQRHYALSVVEILPPEKRFFDYEVKYNGQTREICPANFKPGLKREIEEAARQAHQTLHCRDYSRADMIVSPRGIYLLEVNTLPGLTSESLLPKSAGAIGLDFPNLLDHLINLALNRHRKF
jgi:D-alanine-D-alanine ligase